MNQNTRRFTPGIQNNNPGCVYGCFMWAVDVALFLLFTWLVMSAVNVILAAAVGPGHEIDMWLAMVIWSPIWGLVLLRAALKVWLELT